MNGLVLKQERIYLMSKFNVEDVIIRGVVEDVIKDPEEIKKIYDSIHSTDGKRK